MKSLRWTICSISGHGLTRSTHILNIPPDQPTGQERAVNWPPGAVCLLTSQLAKGRQSTGPGSRPRVVWGLVLLVFLQFSRKSKKTLSSFIESSHFPSVFQKKTKKPKIQDRSAMGEGRVRDEGGLTSSEYVRFCAVLENWRKITTFYESP